MIGGEKVTTDSALSALEIQRRSSRFASLRAAQRALAELAHPAELEQMIERGRKILIELQALSIRATEASTGPRSAEQETADATALEGVDRLLDDLSARTHEILDQKPIAQLRTNLRERSEDHPDEIRGLIDVIIEGDVERDKNLRFLEFLITLLSSEERDTGRAVVREPSEVAPQIGAFAEQRFDVDDPECAAAEAAISSATQKLFDAHTIGSTRDHIREYKKELGLRILHPRVLSATVRYNIAMSNRVAGLVEGSRTIDRLADDLLVPPATAEAPVPSSSLFDSTGFSRIVASLQARLLDEASADVVVTSVASSFELEGLEPAAVEAFETRGEDHAAFLIRAAVTLGLIIRHESRTDPVLRDLGIAPALLATDWLHELAREMTATARKLMAEAKYAEASRLSEMKVKHLAVASTTPEHRGGRARAREVATPSHAAPAKGMRLDATWLRALGLAIGLLAFALLLSPLRGGEESPVAGDFSEVSPYLESGYRSDDGGSARFVGRLSAGWERLDTTERLSVASRIGEGLRQRSIDDVVLLNQHDTVQVRFRDGKVLQVAPRGAARMGR
jgi:hypothetical protein